MLRVWEKWQVLCSADNVNLWFGCGEVLQGGVNSEGSYIRCIR